jgi:methane/ammonia monooxygenase subunit B
LLLVGHVVAVAWPPRDGKKAKDGEARDEVAGAKLDDRLPRLNGESGMRQRFAIGFSALAALVLICGASRVYAHGEAADQPFLKDLTTAFYDVNISPTSIRVGEPITITGAVKILEAWPYTLDPPETAYITPVVPGPVFVLTDRVVNGAPSPGSILVEKGGTYRFRMVIVGRDPGLWHVHPGIAVQGTGTLIGPGEWVKVEPAAAPFKMDVALLSGQKVDLEHYGGRFVWWWSFAGFVIGMIWMVYWTVPKRTVTRLAVTLQVPVNDDAPDIGLITARDHMWMDLLAGITVVMLVGGWVYMAVKYPVRLPQQTVRFAPDNVTSRDHVAQVLNADSTYDDRTDTLAMNVEVKNVGSAPISAKQYIMAMATFVNGGTDEKQKAGPQHYVGQLHVEPNDTIAPGRTAKLRLTMSSDLFDEERLIPLHDPQERIAGLLRFSDTQGRDDLVTVSSVLVPTEFQAQYLP